MEIGQTRGREEEEKGGEKRREEMKREEMKREEERREIWSLSRSLSRAVPVAAKSASASSLHGT